MRLRTKRYGQYGISKKRYKELSGFCEQYPEWNDELKYMQPNIAAKENDGMPFPNTNLNSDTVGSLAVRRATLEEKIKLIEDCAKEAGGDLWEYLIKSACYCEPYYYLQNVCGIPMNRESFYDRRRYFFYLLSQKR